MKKLRIFVVMLLCVSLLTFAGCGEDDNTNDINDETVTEETTDVNNNNDNNGDNIVDDMEDGVDDAVDDMEDAADDVDGKGSSRETNKDGQDGTNN